MKKNLYKNITSHYGKPKGFSGEPEVELFFRFPTFFKVLETWMFFFSLPGALNLDIFSYSFVLSFRYIYKTWSHDPYLATRGYLRKWRYAMFSVLLFYFSAWSIICTIALAVCLSLNEGLTHIMFWKKKIVVAIYRNSSFKVWSYWLYLVATWTISSLIKYVIILLTNNNS